MSEAPAVWILHVPLGIEDPYNPQPWERTPREPLTGEPVSVAAVTQPPGAVERLDVEIVRHGESSRIVPAGAVPYEGEGDRWVAKLGSFPVGQAVSYRFIARTRGIDATTPYFHFECLTWYPLA